jgi:spore maturation protein CgeB
MDSTDPGRQTVACRSLPEFAHKVNYFLVHERERRETVVANSQAVFATSDYQARLADLLYQTIACENI